MLLSQLFGNLVEVAAFGYLVKDFDLGGGKRRHERQELADKRRKTVFAEMFSRYGGSGTGSSFNLTPDENGFVSFGKVTDLLVSWHIQEIVLPSITVEEDPIDPYDPEQVDLSGIGPYEAAPETTAPPEAEGENNG